MSAPADINDRLIAAAEKAEGGAEIFRRVANDPEGTLIPTESGPTPSIKEWLRINAEALGGVPELAAEVALLNQLSADLKSPTVGAGAVKKSVVMVESMLALLTAPQDSTQMVESKAFHSGWAATVAGPQGGGQWLWDATRAKTAHNGVTVVSPTVPWNGSQATLAAFLAGTGETAPAGAGCYVRKFQCVINLMWAGARADGSTDDAAAITKWRDVLAAQSKKRKGYAPAGVYIDSASASRNWAVKGMHVKGDGKHQTVFKSTAGDIAFKIDASEYGTPVVYDVTLKDFCIEGHSGTLHLLFTKNVSHIRTENINTREANVSSGAAMTIQWGVCCTHKNFTCSINEQSMVFRPFWGVVIDQSVGRGASTCNVFENLMIEGVLGGGVRLVVCDQALFNGGTSEANGIYGIITTVNCRMNTFKNFAMEANGTADVFDASQDLRMENCYTGRSIILGSTSSRATITGGLHERLETQAGCADACFDGLTYNYFNTGAGGIVDNGSRTSFRRCFDFDAGTYFYPKKPRTLVTVGASPFTYKNTSGGNEQIFWTGGTISSVAFKRDTDTVPAGITGNLCQLQPDDELVFTFSAVPTVSRIPMGEQFT